MTATCRKTISLRAIITTAVVSAAVLSATSSLAANRYAFATAGQGGTYHILGTGVADIINKKSDLIQLTATSTSGANANVPLIDSGQMMFGMGASPSDMAGYKGNEPFDRAYTDMRTIMVGYVNPGTFVTRADSGIETIEDFRGKKISMPAGGASRTVMTNVLREHGLEVNEDYTLMPMNFSQAVEALQNRRIDVSMQWAAPPSPAVMQMAELFPIRLIPITNEEAIAAVGESLGVVPYTYEANIYEGVDYPVDSVAMLQSFLAHKDAPDEDVQEFIRIVLSSVDELKRIHPIAGQFTPETAARALDYPVPPHPGAVEYFESNGLGN